MAAITSDCGATHSLSIERPESPRACAPFQAEDAIERAIGCNDAKTALIWLVVQKARE